MHITCIVVLLQGESKREKHTSSWIAAGGDVGNARAASTISFRSVFFVLKYESLR